jgi:hypothetical protein
LNVLISNHAYVDLASLDVLLSDRRRLVLTVNKLDALRQLFIIVHDRCLRDTNRAFLAD